jgi:hypothetical protein
MSHSAHRSEARDGSQPNKHIKGYIMRTLTYNYLSTNGEHFEEAVANRLFLEGEELEALIESTFNARRAFAFTNREGRTQTYLRTYLNGEAYYLGFRIEGEDLILTTALTQSMHEFNLRTHELEELEII